MTRFGEGLFGAGLFGSGDPSTSATPPAGPGGVAGGSFLYLLGSNGDRIPLDLDGGNFTALDGAGGIGIPPRALTLIEGAGDGGIVRYARTGPRDIDLPIGIFGTDRGDVLLKQRRLAAALRPRPGQSPPYLRFVLNNGDTYQIAVWYVTGAETTITPTAGTSTYARWPITLRAPDPFWEAVDETPFILGAQVGGGRSLLPALTRLKLSGSVLGAVTLVNPGDVPADITWTIAGPGGPFTATSDRGESFTITDVLDGDDIITVDTKTSRVVDHTGANRYGSLGPAPKLFRLPEGRSTVQITLAGATSASRVVGTYRVRRELVY